MRGDERATYEADHSVGRVEAEIAKLGLHLGQSERERAHDRVEPIAEQYLLLELIQVDEYEEESLREAHDEYGVNEKESNQIGL